eukprot:NODE_461_length_8173_cov_0.353604.p3 type:complete len:286 gc:universal NODE_461_length_8173_cov_0.353604:2844-1987(-)
MELSFQSLSRNDNYTLDTLIGSGSFAKIYKATRRTDKKLFAVKEIYFRSLKKNEKKQIVNEVNIMRELSSSFLVRYIQREIDQPNGILWIVMEYCKGGDLFRFLCNDSGVIPEDIIWIYLAQINEGLKYLHNKKIIHRDVKPHNILFVDDYKLRVKLADFGLSTFNTNFSNTYAGSPYYMCPEMVQSLPYDSKADLWSLGCLCYQLACRSPPFDAPHYNELKDKILYASTPQLNSNYSYLLHEMTSALLTKDPIQRPCSAQLSKHFRIELALYDLKLRYRYYLIM